MSSVSGSDLAFFAPSGAKVNVVLTADGTNLSGPTVAGAFNIEVFTSTPGALGAGFDASAFVQGATIVTGTTNEVRAAHLNSTEQLLAGSYLVIDRTGGESIQMAGSGAQAVVGSAGDTITGSAVSGSQQLFDLSNTNSDVVNKGPMTAIGGAGAAVVWAATGDSIAGGSGPMGVFGNAADNMKVTGGTGALAVVDLGKGNSVTGSTSGFTFVGDGYGGHNNTIGGGAGNGPTNIFGSSFDQGTVIIGGPGDVINGGSGTMLLNALNSGMSITGGSGAATVWGGAGETVNGGGGALQFNVGINSSVSGGAGAVNAFNLLTGNTIGGSSAGTTFIDDSYGLGSNNLLIGGGAAGSTIIGGSGDTINGGAGALEARIKTGFGAETVNLSAAASGVRDVANGGAGTSATVTGFGTNDRIESANNVSGSTFTGSSTVSGGNTILTFTDGNKMTLIGVTDPSKITFTT